MTHSRNHLTPAFIIKRFKPSKNTVESYFPDFSFQYENKKKSPVIKIDKIKLLVESGVIDFNSHEYTNSKSDHFIKNEIYFFNENFLEKIYELSQGKIVKDFLSKIEDKSLEISFNEYESKMSIILDKYLEKNFHDLSYDDIVSITKFIDSGNLRPLKYKKIEDYLKRINNDPIKDLCSFIECNDFLSNTKDFNENKTLDEMVVGYLIMLDFVKNSIPEHKELFEGSFSQIPLLFHMLKNNESIDNLEKTNMIYVKSESDDFFILGDNTVYNLYKSDYPSVIDHINSYLKGIGVIEKDLNKLSIVVVSPNNIIIESNVLTDDENIKVDIFFVKIINTITLFSTDEWIVTKDIIKDIKDVIHPYIFNEIKHFNFFEGSIVKLLSVLNYDIGIANKYDDFDKKYLNNILDYIENEAIYYFSKNPDKKEYPLMKNIVNIDFIYCVDYILIMYFVLKVNKLSRDKMNCNVTIWAYKIIDYGEQYIGGYKYIKCLIKDLDRNIEYDFLSIEIQL